MRLRTEEEVKRRGRLQGETSGHTRSSTEWETEEKSFGDLMTEDDTRHNFISNLSSPRRVFQILPHHFPSNLAPILPLPSLPRSPPFLHFVPGGVSPPQHSEQRGRERGKGGKERRWEERVGCREWGRRGEPRLQSKAKSKEFDNLEKCKCTFFFLHLYRFLNAFRLRT